MLLKQSYQRFFASHPKLLSKLSKLPVLNTSWLPEILHFTLHLWKTSAKTNWLVCKQLPMQNIVATAQSEHLCQDGWYWRGMVLIWIIRIWFRLSAKALFIWRVFCKKTCPTIQQYQSSTKTVSFHFYPSSILKKQKIQHTTILLSPFIHQILLFLLSHSSQLLGYPTLKPPKAVFWRSWSNFASAWWWSSSKISCIVAQ